MKSSTKKIIILILSLLFVLGGIFTVFFGTDGVFTRKAVANDTVTVTTDDGVTFSFEEVPEFIKTGTRYVIPEAKATFNGTTKNTSFIVTFPDGSCSSDASVRLTCGGKYIISWYANFNDSIYKYSRPFNVGYEGDALFTAGLNTEVTTGYEHGGRKGTLISSTKNGRAAYAIPLNVSNYGAGSELVEFKILPSKNGAADFSKLIMTFTDVKDSSKYFTLNFNDSTDDEGRAITRIRAGASGQALCGLNNGAVDRTSLGGTAILPTFTGENTENKDTVKIYYDNGNLEVFAAYGAYGENISLIASFGSEEFYSSKSLWSGFISNEVKLTLSFEGQTGERADVLMLSVGGQSLAEAVDGAAPVINVDYGENIGSELPTGYVGISYPLFKASAHSIDTGKPVDIVAKVYKNYGLEDMALCNEDTYGNIFIPSSEGEYTIQYSAKDASGRRTVLAVKFKVEKFYPAPKLKLNFDMPSNMRPGESLTLTDFTVSGGSGKITTEILLVDNDTEKVLENTFNAVVPGDYTLRYAMTDFTGMTEYKDYNVTVVDTTVPTFTVLPKIAKTAVNGNEISLLPTEAKYYDPADLTVKTAEIKIEAEYGSKAIVEDSFVPDVLNNGDTVKLIFTAINPNTNETTVKDFDVKIIKIYDADDNLQLDRLFETENIDNVEKSSDRITFISSSAAKTPKIKFINSFVANGFSFSFRFAEGDSERINFTDLKITLTDSEDESIAVDLFITKRSAAYNTSYFGINEKGTTEITSNFFGNYNRDFNVRYSASAKSIIDGNNAAVLGVIEKTNGGKTFNGFLSNKVYFSVEIIGTTGVSCVGVKMLGNQPITATLGDFVAPQINKLDELNNFVTEGNEIIVPAAVASDAIKGDCVPYVTVTAPDKTVIYDKADISEPLIFTAEQCGVYSIEYYVTDGNEYTILSYNVTSRRNVKPEISVSAKLKNGKVNTQYKVPSAKVNNLPDGEYVLIVVAVNPYGFYETVENGAFVPSVAGNYIIRYYARDAYYNYSFVDFEISIK